MDWPGAYRGARCMARHCLPKTSTVTRRTYFKHVILEKREVLKESDFAPMNEANKIEPSHSARKALPEFAEVPMEFTLAYLSTK